MSEWNVNVDHTSTMFTMKTIYFKISKKKKLFNAN